MAFLYICEIIEGRTACDFPHGGPLRGKARKGWSVIFCKHSAAQDSAKVVRRGDAVTKMSFEKAQLQFIKNVHEKNVPDLLFLFLNGALRFK